MKLHLYILLLFCFILRLEEGLVAQVQQDHVVVEIKTSLIEEDGKYIKGDIYFTAGRFTEEYDDYVAALGSWEILADVNSDYFNLVGSEFFFEPTSEEWSSLYETVLSRVYEKSGKWYMQMACLNVASNKTFRNCMNDPETCPIALVAQQEKLIGTFKWKLKNGVSGILKIRIRDALIDDDTPSGACDTEDNDIILDFVGDNVEYDADGSPLLVINTSPFDELAAPKDLAGDTLVCGTPQTLAYTVKRPDGVDNCVWSIVAEDGITPADNVASIHTTENGEKATITWNSISGGTGTYYIQVRSQQGSDESDPVTLKVRVEDFPDSGDFIKSVTENIQCRQTELAWTSPSGMVTEFYLPDYAGGAQTSPYTCKKEGTYHFVRYRTAACKDTVDFTPSFLDPKLTWYKAPAEKVQRGEEFNALLNQVEGIPEKYTPSTTEYFWLKPVEQPKNYTNCAVKAVNKEYLFEVYAEVDGCRSDTLTGKTEVEGGGIRPEIGTESGQLIACRGGVMLKSEPDGGSGNYDYKWYAGSVGGTPLAATQSVWVTPTADTKYFVVVTDRTSGEVVRDSVVIAYKDVESPVVGAGEDQRILSGTYTHLLGSVTTDGASAVYTWNWRPADKLTPGSANLQYARTLDLTAQQEYALFVVDGNGCMSKPDTVKVAVDNDLPPGLEPDVPGDFSVAVVPDNITLCKNNSVQFDVVASGINLEGAAYEWLPAAGLSDTRVQRPVLTAGEGVVSGDYFVQVSKGDFRIVRKAAVTVNTAEEAPRLQLAEQRMKCTGDVIEVKVTGNEPDRYIWIVDGKQTSLTGKTYTLTEAGSHTVSVYGKNDGATCASDTLTVSGTIGEGVFLTDVTPDVKICGDQAELSFASVTPAGSPFKWLAADNSVISGSDKSITVRTSGEYRIVVGSGICADTNRIGVVLGNVLSVSGLRELVTGCRDTAQLMFDATTSPSFVWLDPDGVEIAGSKDKNPYTVNREGTYRLRLDGGDCEETYPVSVALHEQPLISGVSDTMTTCGEELALVGMASEGVLRWSEDLAGTVSVDKFAGSNETKTYYVYADGGEGCRSASRKVSVIFGGKPKVLADELQTTCGLPYTLRASSTGTGGVKWYESQTATTPIPEVITQAAGASREYWVSAEDGDNCKSERTKVTVKFGVAPELTVAELQTDCENELELKASATGGRLIWKERGSASELLLTRVSGNKGDIKFYEVHAEDGSCVSETKTVEVRFGANPDVLADNLYTTCGTQFTLQGSASGGTLYWYSDAAGKNTLPSLTVSKGTSDVTTYYAQAVDGTCKSPLKDVRVAFNSDPYVEALSPQTSCTSGTVLALKATTTGGTLVWENEAGMKLASATVNGAGIYYVYAEDGVCRSTKERVEVKFNASPVVNVENSQTVCGEEYDLKATASGGVLKWFDNAGKEIAARVTGEVAEQKTYRVKAVDGACESAEETVSVSFGAPPILTVSPEIETCEDVVKLTASTTGGSLYWKKKGSADVLPIPQVSGTAGTSEIYTVYAQDGTCTSQTKDVKIIFGDKPQFGVPSLLTACGENYTLPSSIDGIDVTWLEADKSTAVRNLDLSGTKGSSAVYWVYADVNGCSSDLAEVTVAFGELPEVEAISPQTTCSTSLTLAATVSGGAPVWRNASGTVLTDLTVGGQSGQTARYYVKAKDGSCEGAEKEVEVHFGEKPQVIVEKDITVCGEEYALTASSTDREAAVHWLEADKTTPVTVAKGASGSSKKYYVYASAPACGDGEMTEVTVHFGASPTLQADPITTCDTIAVLAAESSVKDLVWTDADGKTLASTQVHGPAGSTRVYYVQAKDKTCESERKAVQVGFGQNPEVIAEEIQTVCAGEEYELTARATGSAGIVWYQADGITPLTSTTVRKVGGSTLVYYAEAKDGTCVSEKKKVTVLFDQAPLLNIEKNLLTTCGEALTLEASASAGNIVWTKEDGTVLDLPRVSGSAGEVQTYYVYAQDGTCESVKKTVEVRFGVVPEVDVAVVQTDCEESHVLTAVASDGVLHWLASDKTTELAGTTVTGSKGTQKTYYVYAENGKDCKSGLTEVTVMFGAAPMVEEVLSPQTTCGTSLQLEAKVTGGEAEWRDAFGTLLSTTWVSQTEPGEYTYYVQAKDGACAGASQAVTVGFGTLPEVVCEAVQTTCGTDSYTIEATATQGILHYLDTDRRTPLASPTVTAAGTYYVYAQAPDCVGDTVAVEVKFGTKPEVTLPSAAQSTCEDVLQLQASATGGELFWEKMTPENKVEPLLLPQIAKADGITTCYVYAATSRDEATCKSGKKIVSVSFGAKPEVYVEDMLTTCATENYELKATASEGANVHWLEGDGVTPLASTTVSGAANSTASYWVYADMGSCRSDKKEVTVAFGVAPIVSVLDTLTSCDYDLTLNATTTAGTLKWLNETQSKEVSTTVNSVTGKATVYYVYAQDGSCESVKHKVVALFNTPPSVLADLLQTTCDAESYELQAQATEGTLYWLDFDRTPLTSTTVKGRKGESHEYYVYAENAAKADCKSKEYRITVEFGADPMLDVLTPQTVCGTGEVTVELSASATGGKLVWTDDQGNVLASTQQKANAPATKYYHVHAEDKTCVSVTEKVEVRFGGQPVVFTETLQTACGSSLTLDGTVSSGSLIWSDAGGNNLSSATVTAAGGDTYYALAKDGNCESAKTAVKVLFNENPVVTAVTPQTTCGTLLQLKAETTGGELVWLNANGTKINLTQISAPRGTQATYFVYAKGETCESPKEMVEVEFGTLPKVIAEAEQTACGTSHVLTAVATDGELVWTDASGNALASATVTGDAGESKDYYVYAKAIDCQGEPQKVTVHFGREPMVHVANLQTTCENSLTLKATATAGELLWTTETGAELPTPVVTGNAGENGYYYVTAKDGSCESIKERVEVRFGVTPEVLLASDVFTACGTEYTLEAEATAGQVNWYASKEATVKLASPTVTKPEGADYAEYYAQAQQGSCIGERQKVTVVFNSRPSVTVTTPQTACGTSVLLSATTTGGDLVWTNAKNEELASPVVKGTAGNTAAYYVQARDGSCVSETKEVTVKFGADPSVNVVTDQTVCETKLNLQASATGGNVYWLKDDKSPLASTHVEGARGSAGHYYVYAGDGSCTSDTVEVTVAFGADPRLEAVDVQTSCGDVVELQGKTSGGTLIWTASDGTQILPAVVTKPASGSQMTCYVQAVDGTCTGERKEITVKFGAMPEIFAESLQTSCDTVFTLQASASAGNIVWEDQDHNMLTSATVRGTGIKTYYVYTNAGKDCASEKLKVKAAFGTAPVVHAESLQTSCGTEALELKATASAGTLVWENENGTKLTRTTVTPEMGNSYRVYAVDGKCKGEAETVEVKFGAKPVVTAEPLQTTCGNVLELKATSSAGAVKWLNSGEEPIEAKVSAADGMTQTVYAYASDGTCRSVPVSVEVKFGEQPKLHDLQSAQTACVSPYRLQASSTGGEIVWLKDGREILGNWVDLEEGENIFFVHVEDESCASVATANEKVTVTMGGRPELTLTATQCAGDPVFAEEANDMEGLVYRWFVNGKADATVTGNAYAFAAGGEFTLQVVAETEGGCISDTATETYRIAAPLRLAWDPKPMNSVIYGNNIQGCAKAVSGDDTDISWHWVSPVTPAITGACANIVAREQEYDFEVYAESKSGCSSDTLRATTIVTGFGDLEVKLESSSGTEICKDGSALLTATVNGGLAPYTYEWFVKGTATPVQKVTTSATVNVLAVAPQADVTYVLKVRDSEEMPGIANKEIALTIKDGSIPVADAGPDMTIQRNLQTLLKAGGGDDITAWEWLPADKLASAEETGKQYPQTAVLSTSQKYRLYVTNAEGCVSLPDEMVVFVLPLDGTEIDIPTPPVPEGLNLAILPEKDTLCLGAERRIVVKDLLGNLGNSATYTWVTEPSVTLTMNAGRDSALFIPTAAGDYTFSVFVEDGGKKMALRSDIRVKDGRAPQYDLTVTGDCQYDTVKMVYRDGSVQADRWEWKVKGNAVANAADYYVLSAAGNYNVEVTAGNGSCGSVRKATDVTVAAAPQITDLAVVDSCGRAVIEVTATGATAGYTWTATPEGALESGSDTRYVITDEGKYEVTVEASNGTCSAARTLAGEVYALPRLLTWTVEPTDVSSTDVDITAAVSAQGGKPAYVYHWLQPDGAAAVTTGSYTQTAELANYTFEVYASDANGCLTDTLKKTVSVSGGKVEVDIESVYGKQICAGGAAMLVAHAKGAELPCLMEWSKAGAGVCRSTVSRSGSDTLWVNASDAGNYSIRVRKDASSSILASAQLDGLTVDASRTAPVLTAESTLTVPEGGKTVLLAAVSGGSPEYGWHWSPADKLETPEDTARQYPQTAALNAAQEYGVYVTDAASCVSVPAKILVEIDNKNGLCIAIYPKISEICRGNAVPMNVDVTCGKPVDYALEYAWLPEESSAWLDATDKDSVVFTPGNAGEYTLAVQVKNGAAVAAARTTVTVRDADAPVLTLDGHWDCVNDTLILTNNGEPAEKYVWTVDGIEVAETGERLVLADTGMSRVNVYAVAANGCLSDSISVETQLGVVPEVEIAGGAFVNYPDSVNTLRVKQTDGLTAEAYDFAWISLPDNKINGATNLLSAITLPMDGDARYAFTATSKANAACWGSDTVNGYMIPQTAPVKIDKDENTGELYLAWSQEDLGLADSVRVMNIKWDGYAVNSSYQPKAMEKGDVGKYIINTSKDTLEFFYINASRYIPELGRSYYSLSSDTVGYFRQWVYSNFDNGVVNYISYPFDMPKLTTNQDLAEYIGMKTINDVFGFINSETGVWSTIQYRKVGTKTQWMSAANAKIELKIGSIYKLEPSANTLNTYFTLYGKLPEKISYNFEADKTTWLFIPLSYGYDVMIGDLGTDMGLQINSSLSIYEVEKQSFTTIQYRKVGTKLQWMSAANAKKQKTLWAPISIISSESLNWEK